MKRAPFVALAAIALFVGTLAASRRGAAPGQDVALDFTGIDTLVVVTPQVRVEISADKRARATIEALHRAAAPPPLKVERRGNELHVRTEGDSYADLVVVAPPHVRAFEIGNGTVEAAVPLASVELRLRNDGSPYRQVTWQGSARALRIVDAPGRALPCKESCQRLLTVGSGAIGELHVATRRWSVKLDAAESIDRGTVALGPGATLTLSDLRAIPRQLQVVELDAASSPPDGDVRVDD